MARTESVEAVVKDGLAIHRSLSNGLWQWRWTVSHVQSGYAMVCGLPTPMDALECLNDLLPLADWNQDKEHIACFRHKIIPVLRAHEQKVIYADCGNQYL